MYAPRSLLRAFSPSKSPQCHQHPLQACYHNAYSHSSRDQVLLPASLPKNANGFPPRLVIHFTAHRQPVLRRRPVSVCRIHLPYHSIPTWHRHVLPTVSPPRSAMPYRLLCSASEPLLMQAVEPESLLRTPLFQLHSPNPDVLLRFRLLGEIHRHHHSLRLSTVHHQFRHPRHAYTVNRQSGPVPCRRFPLPTHLSTSFVPLSMSGDLQAARKTPQHNRVHSPGRLFPHPPQAQYRFPLRLFRHLLCLRDSLHPH